MLRPSAPPADRPRAVTLDVPVAKDADPDTSGVESPLESEATELIPAAPPRSSPARVRRSMPPNDEAPPRPSSLVDRVGADATAPSPAPRRSAPRPAPVATAARPTASRAPLIIGGALLLVTVAVLFPIPSTQRLDVELVPTRKAEPKTPAGVFGTLKVPSGTRVDQGAVIATLDVSKLKADRDELKATVARLESAAAKTSSKTNPAVLKKARLAVAKANQELAKAKAVAAKRRDDSKAQQDVAKKEAALEQAQRVAESADGNQKAKAMRAEAAQVKQRAAALDKQLERANIVAPATGVFELEAVPPAGAQFDDGTPFGRILDSTLLVKGAPADAVDPVLITPDRRIPLFAVDRKPEGLTVPFEGNVKPGPAKLEIPKGYRPWPMVLLAR
ncbi:MAG: hypothetical protein IPJ65_38370 [Archangiaceae bacterium]|nr:hypothetical protein [Archangiaceae bacterium]